MRRLVAVLPLVVACKKDAPAPEVDPAYRDDVERICEVERLSGMLDRPDENPQYVTAMWLGDNIQTPEARKFLAELSPLVGVDKAKRLREEATRVGLGSCVLAATWEKTAAGE